MQKNKNIVFRYKKTNYVTDNKSDPLKDFSTLIQTARKIVIQHDAVSISASNQYSFEFNYKSKSEGNLYYKIFSE